MTQPLHRHEARVLAISLLLGSWVSSGILIRVGLDWSDTQPYAPWVETYYLCVAAVALVVAFGGSLLSVLLFLRARRSDGRGVRVQNGGGSASGANET